ncbi:helix-turn-helix domain-containing protein [Mycobacterium sp.]|uniref:helix-turn-helix domain-containing protein n=1 Tax=Mycobacterium sp. TaxID=1785 RepID=UPI003D0C751A
MSGGEVAKPEVPAPNELLDISQLGPMLREHRGNLSLRQAAQEANVSFSTFSRVEAGSQPDLTSFTLLCAWLGVPPSHFFAPAPAREVAPIDVVVSHLSSDPRLAPDAARKITEMLRSMYQALATETTERPVVACHLRAASTLRPGVPERLNALLTKMRDELERKVATGEL